MPGTRCVCAYSGAAKTIMCITIKCDEFAVFPDHWFFYHPVYKFIRACVRRRRQRLGCGIRMLRARYSFSSYFFASVHNNRCIVFAYLYVIMYIHNRLQTWINIRTKWFYQKWIYFSIFFFMVEKIYFFCILLILILQIWRDIFVINIHPLTHCQINSKIIIINHNWSMNEIFFRILIFIVPIPYMFFFTLTRMCVINYYHRAYIFTQ